MPSPNLLRDCQLAGGLELQVWEPGAGLIRLANHFSLHCPSRSDTRYTGHLFPIHPVCIPMHMFVGRFQDWSLVLIFMFVFKSENGDWPRFEQLNNLDGASQIWPILKIIRGIYYKTHSSRHCPDLLNCSIKISRARDWKFSFLTRPWDDSIPRWFGSHCSKRKNIFIFEFKGFKKIDV